MLDLLSNALLLSQAVARSMFRATVPASDVLEVRPFVRSRSDCRATPALRDGHNAQPSPCEPGAAGAVLHLCRGDALELTPEGVAPSAAWHQRCAQVLGGRRDFERIRVLLFRAVGWDMLADMRAVLPPSSLHSVWRKGGFRPPSHFLGCFVLGVLCWVFCLRLPSNVRCRDVNAQDGNRFGLAFVGIDRIGSDLHQNAQCNVRTRAHLRTQNTRTPPVVTGAGGCGHILGHAEGMLDVARGLSRGVSFLPSHRRIACCRCARACTSSTSPSQRTAPSPIASTCVTPRHAARALRHHARRETTCVGCNGLTA